MKDKNIQRIFQYFLMMRNSMGLIFKYFYNQLVLLNISEQIIEKIIVFIRHFIILCKLMRFLKKEVIIHYKKVHQVHILILKKTHTNFLNLNQYLNQYLNPYQKSNLSFHQVNLQMKILEKNIIIEKLIRMKKNKYKR